MVRQFQLDAHLQEDLNVDGNLIDKVDDYYDISILSGDGSDKVSRLAEKLGIKNALGDQTPEDKLAFVKNIQKTEEKLANITENKKINLI